MKHCTNILSSVFILALTIPQALSADEYKIAVRAHKGIESAIKKWKPTIDYLSYKLPYQFTLIPIISLKEITNRVGNNEFEFVLTNPSSYIEIHQRFGAKAIATLNNKRANTAQDRFGSVIFTHANNTRILTIHDLKDKTLIAVSPQAFGGWRVAWLEMLNNGFNPYSDLKELKFTQSKTQPEVVQSILSRKADAGVVRTDLLERLEKENKIDLRYLRILNNKDIKDFPFFLSTELYPEWAFAATKKAPTELAEKVKKILMSIPQTSSVAKSGKYIKWIKPDNYEKVKVLMKKLKVAPYAEQ